MDFSWLPTKRNCDCAPGRLNCLTRAELLKLGSTIIDVKPRQRWREKHGGRFIPQVPEKFIKLFSHPGETVLDPFCGSGTTNLVAKQLGRNSIALDVNPYSIGITLKRLGDSDAYATRHEVVQGSCVEIMELMPRAAIDLIVTSPPYFDVMDYEDSSPEQWGNIHEYAGFLDKMRLALAAMRRVIKSGGYLVLVTQDVYKRKAKCPLHSDYIQMSRELGLEVMSTQVYVLNYSSGGRLVYGYPRSYYPKNDHEFIVVLRKEEAV